MRSATLPPTFVNASPLVNAIGMKHDALGFFTRLAREAGNFAHYALPSGIYYFVNEPALIRDILVTRRDEFVKWNFNDAFKLIFRDGLIGSEEPLHRRMHRVVRPAFAGGRVAEHAERMVAIAQQRLATWRGGELDLAREASLLTLEIVGQCLFSVSLVEVAEEILDSIDTFERLSGRLGSAPEDDRVFTDVIAALDRIVRALLAERQRAGQSDDDLLDLLIAAQQRDGAAVTDERIHDEMITFLLAGHMTTAAVLACACWLLARNPGLQAELHAQVRTALHGRPPALADLPALAACERVLWETMRLYPPVWGFGREALREVVLDGCALVPGDRLVICPWVLHRDPQRFPDPERFRPERWEHGARESLPAGSFLPFSIGPRSCLGERFAMLEGTLLLACLVQRWHFGECPDADPSWSPQVILWPRRGVRLHVSLRDGPHLSS